VEREREKKSVKYCGTLPVVNTGENDCRGSISWAAKFIRQSATARSSLAEAVGNGYSGSTLVAASDSSRWTMAAANPKVHSAQMLRFLDDRRRVTGTIEMMLETNVLQEDCSLPGRMGRG
jgi:hypothetical protein